MTTAPPPRPKRGRASAPPGGGCLRPGPSGPASAPPGGGCLRWPLLAWHPPAWPMRASPATSGGRRVVCRPRCYRQTKAVCRGPSAPSVRASARRPVPRCSLGAASGPPSLRGFACRLRRHRCAVSVPAPACWLGLSAPAASRPSAAAPGPPPPRCASACGLRRLGAPALAPVAAVALACCGWASGPPSAVCGLPAFPWAVPGGGAPRVGPSRRLPSLVPRSVGGLVGLRAPGLPPGPPAALRAAFFGPPARASGVWCSAPAGAGIPPPAGGGRGDHLASWLSWRLRVV